MAKPVLPAPGGGRRPPHLGTALLLVLAGLVLVMLVQLWAPQERWLRVAAVAVAVGAPMLFLALGLRAYHRDREGRSP